MVTLSETKGLVFRLRTGSVKDLVTEGKDKILRTAQNDIIEVFACRSNSSYRDPFDRILIAQEQLENMPIITTDTLIALYDVKIIWGQ